MSDYMGDLSGYLQSTTVGTKGTVPVHSTVRKNADTLDMMDFLNLMVVQMQNQTMDDTADTSDMMNQLVQMQVVQSINSITDATVMTYASSLVGKDVTVGEYDSDGRLVETPVHITGTGYANGEQVLFAGDKVYSLTDIMAVGRLPEIKDEEDSATKPVDPDKPTNPTEPTDPAEPTDPEDPDKPTDPTDPEEPAGPDQEYEGENGADVKPEQV